MLPKKLKHNNKFVVFDWYCVMYICTYLNTLGWLTLNISFTIKEGFKSVNMLCLIILLHITIPHYCTDIKLTVYTPHTVFIYSLSLWHMLWYAMYIITYFYSIWWQIRYPIVFLNRIQVLRMHNKWLIDDCSWLILHRILN